ncbi:MAG: RNA polymerase sigma factor [Prevotella sp.]|nr:RNA polymerase sigma factor [Prevotella sp.]
MGHNNEETMEAVIGSERDSLLRLACCRTGDVDDAADIVQDVLMKTWKRKDAVAIADVRGYLYRSLFNACATYRHRRASVTFVPVSADIPAEAPADDGTAAEYRRIMRLLETIPAEQAEVISLRTAGGKSFAEIAGILGLPLPSVKSRFRYGIEKIRKMIYDSPKKTKRL